MQRNHELAVRVRADDDVIDKFEIEIDEMAIQLLTKAPLASNLRLVTVAMKISQNLERIGDEATKIAKRARDLSHEPPVKIQPWICRAWPTLALAMVKDALDSFVQKDSAAARTIIPRDKEVDALNKQIHQQLAQHMMENPTPLAVACIGLSLPRASNASPTTRRTSPRKWFISARRRTSGIRRKTDFPCAVKFFW